MSRYIEVAKLSKFVKDPPPADFLYGDCTRNHPVYKYNSYGVNFSQKSILYIPRGNFSNYLWKLLFLANCFVRNQQLLRSRTIWKINLFLCIIYFLIQRKKSKTNSYVHSNRFWSNPKWICLNWNTMYPMTWNKNDVE